MAVLVYQFVYIIEEERFFFIDTNKKENLNRFFDGMNLFNLFKTLIKKINHF